MVAIVKPGNLQKDMCCALKLSEITLHEIDTHSGPSAFGSDFTPR
jgi:hypothetical protein